MPAETKPPIERPEATAQRGVPTASSNRSRAAAWLSMAAAMFQPVTVRVVPPTAYPRSVSSPVSGSSAARLAKSRSTTITPFQRFGTANRYGVPSASSPPVQVTPEGEPAGHGPVSRPPASAPVAASAATPTTATLTAMVRRTRPDDMMLLFGRSISARPAG
ncbi:hypothetical protein [Streptomyces tendae]|uniref:hypothetical protein n=1 Tax=Streptomyces tendae TaxID=1932 RepID=UPI0036640807